jgi:uncharacterized protein YjiS (DUF1127 family)
MATFSFTSDVVSHEAGSDRPSTTSTVFNQIRRALEVRRQRKALLALDERMLADVGLSKADVYREAHRTFLDLPGDQPRSNW